MIIIITIDYVTFFNWYCRFPFDDSKHARIMNNTMHKIFEDKLEERKSNIQHFSSQIELSTKTKNTKTCLTAILTKSQRVILDRPLLRLSVIHPARDRRARSSSTKTQKKRARKRFWRSVRRGGLVAGLRPDTGQLLSEASPFRIARRRRHLKIVCVVGSGRILAVCLEREFAEDLGRQRRSGSWAKRIRFQRAAIGRWWKQNCRLSLTVFGRNFALLVCVCAAVVG